MNTLNYNRILSIFMELTFLCLLGMLIHTQIILNIPVVFVKYMSAKC